MKIDINCDLGESYGAFKMGNDEEIMPHITSANIACGFHAGDPVTINRTVTLAKKYKVAVGAHPSFPDLLGFGRREMHLSEEELKNCMIYQVSAITGFAKIADMRLQHVKPHGALYNMATTDEKISRAIVDAVKASDPNLIIFTMPNAALAKVAAKTGLRVAHEFFADRAYNSDGTLASRKHLNAILQEPKEVVRRTVMAVKQGFVKAVDGNELSLNKIHTVCIHGDNPAASNLVKALRKDMPKNGIKVEHVSTFL